MIQRRIEYDILVIGGGISGASIAREAILRGHKTALVEKKDFGHATSSATSKLIHGGLRYLAKLDLPIVRESLRERRRLLNNLASQAFPLPFLFPIYDWTPTSTWMLKAGLTIYDLLSFNKNNLRYSEKKLQNHRWLSKNEALTWEPKLSPKGLKGAFLYFDVLNNHPSRSNLDYILSAEREGADVANYTEMIRFIYNPDRRIVSGAEVLDKRSGEKYSINARITINATGPWGDFNLTNLEEKPIRKIVRSKGIHILLPKCHGRTTITFETKNKHHFFIIPWKNATLLGTTDTPFHQDPDELHVTKAEAQKFWNLVSEYFPAIRPLNESTNFYAGLRPLVVEDKSQDTYGTSRKHEIISHGQMEKIYGLFSVFGGKWTTSRALAEEVISMVEKQSSLSRYYAPSPSRKIPLSSSRYGSSQIEFEMSLIDQYRNQIPIPLLRHFLEYYGSNAVYLIRHLLQDPKNRLKPIPETQHVLGEISFSVEHEHALTISDIVFRRTGIANQQIPSVPTLKKIATELAPLTKAGGKEQARQIQEVQSQLTLQ